MEKHRKHTRTVDIGSGNDVFREPRVRTRFRVLVHHRDGMPRIESRIPVLRDHVVDLERRESALEVEHEEYVE